MPRRVGPSGHKSEVVTVRMTPKLRYGLELMARLHQETVPEVITRAIASAFTAEYGGLFVYADGDNEYPRNLLELAWAERPSDRLVNLALRYPNVMSRAERAIWSAIKAKAKYWRSERSRRATVSDENAVLRDVIAEDWTAISDSTNSQLLG